MLGAIINAVAGPVIGIFQKKQERAAAREALAGKIAAAKQQGDLTLNLNDQEAEAIGVAMTEKTWRDEYVTVSVMSIFNVIVLGGILDAAGYPQVLTGISTAVLTLVEIGVDVGFLMTVTVMAGLGLTALRRIK
jgi:hypothetical protein